MAYIIKNQILKHLSRFCKNMSPDKVNVSIMKGEGELTNVELDEILLMDLLDLPTWLILSKAFCKRVRVRIQWTKLKSKPIMLILDEVILEVETCNEPRPPNSSSQPPSPSRTPSKYGFVEKVLDGVGITVDSVSVNFHSNTFHAFLELQWVKVYSVSPLWAPVNDLRMTRIRDADRGEILIFKEINWMTTRIEANGTNIPDHANISPLRLIANQSKIRITLKKNVNDCSIISSRIIFLLDDLLWVLTDTQLKAAILYANSLKTAINKSANQSKILASEKLKKQSQTPQHLHPGYQQPNQINKTAISQYFSRFDLHTTSYHFETSRFDLHLCDEGNPSEDKKNYSVQGGAMQIIIQKLALDFYPFHQAGGERKLWHRYSDNLGSRNQWVQELFTLFKQQVQKAKDNLAEHYKQSSLIQREYSGLSEANSAISDHTKPSPSSPYKHASPKSSMGPPTSNHISPLNYDAVENNPSHLRSRSRPSSPCRSSQRFSSRPSSPRAFCPPHQATSQQNLFVNQNAQRGQQTTTAAAATAKATKLLESCFVVKVEDFVINCVSIAGASKKNVHRSFFGSDKKQLNLPQEMSVVQLEYTDYYFPDGITHPVPNSNIYLLLNPVKLTLDVPTILWCNYFLHSIIQGLPLSESSRLNVHVDIKAEAVLPRIVLPAEDRVAGQHDRPSAVQIQMSKCCVTNTRVDSKCTKNDLKSLLENLDNCDLLNVKEFPNAGNKYISIPQQLRDYAEDCGVEFLHPTTKDLLHNHALLVPISSDDLKLRDLITQYLRSDTFDTNSACDVWSLSTDDLWLEFTGMESSPNRPITFVESTPCTFWLCRPVAMIKTPDDDLDAKSQQALSSSDDDDSSNSESPFLRQRSSTSRHDTIRLDLPSMPNRTLHKQTSVDSNFDETISDENLSDSSAELNTLHPPLTSDGYRRSPILRTPTIISETQPRELLADNYVFADIRSKLRVQLNHYHYLFLLRLLDTFSSLQQKLRADLQKLCPVSSHQQTTCVPLRVNDFELALVLPAVPQPSVTPSSRTFSSPIMDLGNVNSQRNTDGNCFKKFPSIDTGYNTAQSGDQSLAADIMSSSVEPPRLFSFGGRNSHDNQQKHPSNPHNRNPGSDPYFSGRPPLKKTPSVAEVKKSLSNALTNISDKLKVRGETADDVCSVYSDDVDSTSVITDQSSDDDFDRIQLILDESNETPAFDSLAFHPPLQADSIPDDLDPDINDLTMQFLMEEHNKEQVSIVVFRLANSQVILQSLADDIIARAQAGAIAIHETGNVHYDEFHASFSTKTGFVSHPIMTDPDIGPTLKLIYMIGPVAENLSHHGNERGYLDLRAHDIDTDLLLSTLEHLAYFIEDEVIPDPTPMTIHLADLTIHLKEDRPIESETSPGPVPIDVHLKQAVISRTDDGVFHINTTDYSDVFKSSKKSKEPNVDVVNDIKPIATSSQEQLDLQAVIEERDGVKRQNWELLRELDLLTEERNAADRETEILHQENEALRHQMQKMAEFHNSNTRATSIRNENHAPGRRSSTDKRDFTHSHLERIALLENELSLMKHERESLVSTLHFLQNELHSTEQLRVVRVNNCTPGQSPCTTPNLSPRSSSHKL